MTKKLLVVTVLVFQSGVTLWAAPQATDTNMLQLGVKSVGPGTVTSVGTDDGQKFVVIDRGDGTFFKYKGVSLISVNVGRTIKMGDVVGFLSYDKPTAEVQTLEDNKVTSTITKSLSE